MADKNTRILEILQLIFFWLLRAANTKYTLRVCFPQEKRFFRILFPRNKARLLNFAAPFELFLNC